VDLAAALQKLPEEYRSVVLLADVEDFTMTEVAAIMGCPVGTVKSRLFRARTILQELLRDYVH
jgi:RNA polymerase sigma-70 factor (ECF subfamily)